MSTLTGGSYTRMSQDIRQLGDGVERQYEANHELAAKDGVPIIAEFEDNDISAYDPKKVRPDFEKVLHAIERHEFDILYLWHTDRLYRQMGDAVRLLNAARKGGVVLRPVKGSRIDPAKAGDEMTAYILAAVGGYESRHHAERRRAANDQKAARGDWETAHRPFGYTMTGEPHPTEAQEFRQAVDAILAGKSMKSIVRDWNARGITSTRGNTWNGGRLRDTMVKPRYAALKVLRGKVVGPGQWEPLIDLDTHHSLVNFLTNPARSNGRSSWEQKHMGSGLYRCGVCDDGTTVKSHGGGERYPTSYTCRERTHISIGAKMVDDWITARILDFFADQDCHLLIHVTADTAELAKQIDGVRAEKELLSAAVDAGDLDVADYLIAVKSRTKRLNELESQRAAATGVTAAGTLIDVSQKAHKAGTDALEAVTAFWATMSATQRAQAIDEVATVTVHRANKKGPQRGRFDEGRVTLARRRAAKVSPKT